LYGQENNTENKNELANKIQNPVADLVQLPFQNNTTFYNDEVSNSLNIQPVTPFSIKNKFNIILRSIFPIVTNPFVNETGLGNVSLSAFFTPKVPKKIIWGIGPAIQFGANKNFGLERSSIAPSGVALYQKDGWTFGGLFQNFFGLGSSSSKPDVNFFYTQIFITKNLPKGWYVNTSPIITYNWEAKNDDGLTLPLGGGFGRLFRLGKLPINASLGYYRFIEHPQNANDLLRIQLKLILPKFY
jgi:hypothetical protein